MDEGVRFRSTPSCSQSQGRSQHDDLEVETARRSLQQQQDCYDAAKAGNGKGKGKGKETVEGATKAIFKLMPAEQREVCPFWNNHKV